MIHPFEVVPHTVYKTYGDAYKQTSYVYYHVTSYVTLIYTWGYTDAGIYLSCKDV